MAASGTLSHFVQFLRHFGSRAILFSRVTQNGGRDNALKSKVLRLFDGSVVTVTNNSFLFKYVREES